MKSLRSLLLVVPALSLAFSTAALAAENEAGIIDIGPLTPSAKGQFVEVNLSQAMLKFAAKLAARREPEAAELIRNLKSIRVNVVGLDDSNRAATVGQIELLRRKLEAQGWVKIVTVREKDGDNVDIHVKQHGEEAINGLVVTVMDKKGEVVFVNVVGDINADQIGKIAEKFGIDPLRKLPAKLEPKNKDKDA
jgi:hypothetical protein